MQKVKSFFPLAPKKRTLFLLLWHLLKIPMYIYLFHDFFSSNLKTLLGFWDALSKRDRMGFPGYIFLETEEERHQYSGDLLCVMQFNTLLFHAGMKSEGNSWNGRAFLDGSIFQLLLLHDDCMTLQQTNFYSP